MYLPPLASRSTGSRRGCQDASSVSRTRGKKTTECAMCAVFLGGDCLAISQKQTCVTVERAPLSRAAAAQRLVLPRPLLARKAPVGASVFVFAGVGELVEERRALGVRAHEDGVQGLEGAGGESFNKYGSYMILHEFIQRNTQKERLTTQKTQPPKKQSTFPPPTPPLVITHSLPRSRKEQARGPDSSRRRRQAIVGRWTPAQHSTAHQRPEGRRETLCER